MEKDTRVTVDEIITSSLIDIFPKAKYEGKGKLTEEITRETEYGDNDFDSNCFSAGQASFPLPDINRKVEKDNNGENVGFGGVWKDLNANLSKIDHHGF
ncbi:hypothetical protein H5410_039767 [Solanum commersonii]|uniref:Uncharacterized protein n=1 Tax=Solanum commersonii TaxID=4109 RepID=A0A9J5XN33_SOLCO|nr:hypothetical protein H5410_039767 [Solanum commersonii]